MYKINLQNLNESNWIGSKICLKKNFPQPQKLRNMKFKNYPFWRVDKLNTQIINGGWHFSFLQNPKDIATKIKSYSHGEFNKKEIIDEKKIQSKIEKNEDIFGRGFSLKKIEIADNYPDFIIKNKENLKDWII
jgi:beta-1,4-mannosyl-glycoprotein beta-1,4-N-acetylglucosaminyltransferase